MAGGAVLIAGFMYKFSSGFLEVQVTSMFNTILINTIPLGVLADAVAYIMIIVGGLVVFMAIFGMIGGWKGIRGCLWAVSKHDISKFLSNFVFVIMKYFRLYED